MKGTLLFMCSAFALALSEEVAVDAVGCPVDPTVPKILPHDKYCNLFYSCMAGERVEQRCPEQLVYNALKETCDWPERVDCKGKEIQVYIPSEQDEEEKETPGGNNDPIQAPALCSKDESDGVLVAHENCNRFYVCNGGVPVSIDCPLNLMYNSELGVCDWAANVECGDRTIHQKDTPDSESTEKIENVENTVIVDKPTAYQMCAADPKNNVLIAHEICNKFYKCYFGIPVAFNCPSRLLFNIEKNNCDWPSNVKCGDRPVIEVEEEDHNLDNEDNESSSGLGHSDHSQAVAICSEEKSDGVLIAHEHCNQYYKCWDKVPIVLECPLNLLYNPPLEYCDWPQNVDCGSIFK